MTIALVMVNLPNYHFLLGESSDMDKYLINFKIEIFSNIPTKTIECLYIKSVWQPIFDNKSFGPTTQDFQLLTKLECHTLTLLFILLWKFRTLYKHFWKLISTCCHQYRRKQISRQICGQSKVNYEECKIKSSLYLKV